jgi:hypothetical protein
MNWVKASEERKTLIEQAMSGVDSEKKQMFGYPCYFINGNMFSGLFQDSVFLRLPEEQKPALSARYGKLSPLEPMPGRPMKDYVVLPEKLLASAGKLAEVLKAAASAAAALPPKPGKKKKG